MTTKKTIWGWALYDFGNSAFFTVILSFVYAVFFADTIVPEGDTPGSVIWANGLIVTAIIVALTSPFLGALADYGGYRRRYLFITTVVAILGTALLYFPTPGEVRLALAIFVIANVAAELTQVFYNAYLPDISTPDNIGKISGYGWTEFYGFFAFSAKATAFMGPIVYSVMTTAFGSPRYGVGAIVVFFLIGGLILLSVDERAGVAASGRAAAS